MDREAAVASLGDIKHNACNQIFVLLPLSNKMRFQAFEFIQNIFRHLINGFRHSYHNIGYASNRDTFMNISCGIKDFKTIYNFLLWEYIIKISNAKDENACIR